MIRITLKSGQRPVRRPSEQRILVRHGLGAPFAHQRQLTAFFGHDDDNRIGSLGETDAGPVSRAEMLWGWPLRERQDFLWRKTKA